MRAFFPPGAIASPPSRRRDNVGPNRWRWTAVLIHALRQALCPSPSITSLLEATARGEFDMAESDRRRQPQMTGMPSLLAKWILG